MREIKNKLYIVFGTIFVVLGVIGIFVPLMPSTIFLLIGASCYARGSQRFYTWLMNNRWLGGMIRDYREGRGNPTAPKTIDNDHLVDDDRVKCLFLYRKRMGESIADLHRHGG